MSAKQESCCFTGHRPEKLPWGYDESDARCRALKARLADAVRYAYENGFRHFLCGMAQGCDLYFAEAVLALREKCPDVTLEAAIPCPTQSDGWPAAQRRRWHDIVCRCDAETVVSAAYSAACMQRRDRYMVDHSALLIAAYSGAAGGTQYTIQYALQCGTEILDVSIPE